MADKPYSQKSILIYSALQAGALVVCWIWFAIMWTVASFNFEMNQFEWWILVLAAAAGLFGLRPNLERAIDAAWVGKVSSPAALTERIGQLKPVKRRIDIAFSAVVIFLLLAIIAFWVGGLVGVNIPGQG